jgi:hypothetical protein
LFFIEGVSCVGEIKSQLTSSDLKSVLENCKSFKKLAPKLEVNASAKGSIEDLKRYLDKRPYFLFAFESQLTIETIRERINEFNAESAKNLLEQLDGVFLLDRGALINFGSGTGSLVLIDPAGQSWPGMQVAATNENSNVLIQFLGWLSSVMLKINLSKPPILQYLIPTLPASKQPTPPAKASVNTPKDRKSLVRRKSKPRKMRERT